MYSVKGVTSPLAAKDPLGLQRPLSARFTGGELRGYDGALHPPSDGLVGGVVAIRKTSKLSATSPKAYRLLATIMRSAVRDGCIVRSPVEVKGVSREPTH